MTDVYDKSLREKWADLVAGLATLDSEERLNLICEVLVQKLAGDGKVVELTVGDFEEAFQVQLKSSIDENRCIVKLELVPPEEKGRSGPSLWVPGDA